MQHFVSLDINAPVAGAFPQRQVGVMRQSQAVLAQRFVPLRLDDADFGIADGPDSFERVIGGARNVDDDFVAQRQQRADGRRKRIAQLDTIANEGESADFHKAN